MAERPERRIKNALVSGSFTLCTNAGKKLLSSLVIKTDSVTEKSTSDV